MVDALIGGKQDVESRIGRSQQGAVGNAAPPALDDGRDLVYLGEEPRELSRQAFVDEDAHASGGALDEVVGLAQRFDRVLAAEARIRSEDLV